MQFGRALTFYFTDKHWFRKALTPALYQFIPILGLAAATGWSLEICRRVIRKDADAVPVFQFRRDLAGGLKVWGIVLMSGLPVALWLGLGGVVSALVRNASGGTGDGYWVALWWGIELSALAIALVCGVFAVAAVGRLAETGSVRLTVRIRELFAVVRCAPAAYLRAVLAWIPLGFLAVLGTAICGAGVFFTTAYALGSGFHLAGQAHAAAAERAASGSIPGRR